MFNISKVFLFSYLIVAISSLWGMVLVDTTLPPTLTPTLEPNSSIFSEDTCAPPCWFGLIPGTSTENDVETFIEEFDEDLHIFEISLGSDLNNYAYDKSYRLHWNEHERLDKEGRSASVSIRVEDDVVTLIYAEMNRMVFLDEVVEKLGLPDESFLLIDAYPQLQLDYNETSLTVVLTTDRQNCGEFNFGRSFWVERAVYVTPEGGYTYLNSEYPVSPDLWSSWSEEGFDISCPEALSQIVEQADSVVSDATPSLDLTPTKSQKELG